MAKETKLSDHCLINHFEKLEGKGIEHHEPPLGKMLKLMPLMMLDRKIHFNGLRGSLWKALGVVRSNKNPNICTL